MFLRNQREEVEVEPEVEDQPEPDNLQPDRITLPGFLRTPNTTVNCIFQYCQFQSRRRIPAAVVLRLICRYNLVIPENSRVCDEHLAQGNWHELL